MSTATATTNRRLFGDAARHAIVIVWALACTAGLAVLWRYESTPGAQAGAPVEWPSDTKTDRDERGPTLVMFAHPHCPCTRASIAELERIVAQSGATIQPRVVFFKPADSESDWEQTDLWRSASAIPGAQVICDTDGEEARRFRAKTSGQTMLYDATGKLLFTGGITSSRGHQGDNDGRSTIVNLLTGRSSDRRDMPVFGCPIDVRPDREAHDR